ncbi:MAG TPA: prepilin-type N-terminal cleavage/methylation domain-containing protein [bacterium]|nr:prepilin-type N-terminal cleavage/methylation domain-containing protein [bacterium]HOL48504.1 prepilin-type N-terminal cleavage/methylation domain-containing protein [bacterium]HPQ20001.1 prepilin-type N-terminal cleavage/methylation domain-containing protein [bacterium]
MKNKTGFSLIEIIFAIIVFAIIVSSLFPLIYLFVDFAYSNILLEKSNILINNTVSEINRLNPSLICNINGLYKSDSYTTMPDFPEFKREIYVYDYNAGDTSIKKVHILTKYYVADQTKKENKNETVFLKKCF